MGQWVFFYRLYDSVPVLGDTFRTFEVQIVYTKGLFGILGVGGTSDYRSGVEFKQLY